MNTLYIMIHDNMIRYIDNPNIAYYFFQHCKLRIKAKIKCGSVAYSRKWSILLSKIFLTRQNQNAVYKLQYHYTLSSLRQY